MYGIFEKTHWENWVFGINPFGEMFCPLIHLEKCFVKGIQKLCPNDWTYIQNIKLPHFISSVASITYSHTCISFASILHIVSVYEYVNYFGCQLKWYDLSWLRGYCTSYQKLACFVPYLKIINRFFINYASYKKLFKELKNGIEILVGQVIFKLQIKIVKMFLDQ